MVICWNTVLIYQIDFGDSCDNPTICDLAVCVTYLMMDRDDPLESAAVVIASYNQIRRLCAAELASIFSLVCGRLAVSICIATARQSIDAENMNWFVSLKPAWRLLRQLNAISEEWFLSNLKSAVQE
jgi:ethanolamine-phosphate phospho-lyase